MAHSYNYKDRKGQKVHRLTFLEFVDVTDGGNARWKVRCDCGVEFIAIASNVFYGKTKSCGCYRAELIRNRNKDRKKAK